MDEYDEYDYGYSYEEQMLLLANAHHQAEQQQQQQQLKLCYAVDCHENCCSKVEQEQKDGDDGEAEECKSSSEHRLAIDFDLINATSSQVLENCSTFNDLSLLDAEQQVEPFT